MSGIARGRLAEERKVWRKSHPHTDWEGGYFPLTLHFSEDCPSKPPKWLETGDNGEANLVGIQDLLDQPNPADTEGYQLFIQDAAEYKRRVQQQAKQYPPLV